jgi:hypothetical protein
MMRWDGARASEMNNAYVQLFEEERPRLLGLAYRISLKTVV